MGDATEIRADFKGLYTAPGSAAVPPGGMREATNVVLRRPRVLEPRPGFARAALPAALASGGALGHVEYPLTGNEAGIVHDGTNTYWDGFSGKSGALTTPASAALTWESYAGQVSRKSLYLTTGDALRVVHTPGAAVAYRAGVPAPRLADLGLNSTTVTSTAGPSFAANSYRAYRAVTARGPHSSSAQSHESRSAPSARLIAYRTTATNQPMYVILDKSEDFQVGDVIELYSTENTTTYPTDEMYLNQRVAITSTMITAGFVEITDATVDNELGMALYTNDSREGAEGAHYRPPQAGCIAEFNNSLWLGDLTYPASLDLTFPIVMFGGGASLGDQTFVNRYAHTLTFTAGSATATTASALSGVRVGQLVILSHGTYRVTSYVANTSVTFNTVWAGSSGAASTTFMDSIRIGSEYYPVADIVANMSGVKGSRWHTEAYTASSSYAAEWSDENLTSGAILIQNGDYAVQRMSLTLSTILPTTTPPQVWATHGDLYSPALPEPTAATGVTMPQDILPDGVAWSNQDEPDHFRFDNVERVGRSGATVLCMGASRGSILLATDLGLWRGSGYADSGVSFSELDKNVCAVGRRCMAEAGPFQYLATDAGVFECDENGANSITQNVLTDMDNLFYQASAARNSLIKVVGNGKDDEILVCVPPLYNSAYMAGMYVFNQNTRAWALWVPPDSVTDVTVKGAQRLICGTVYNAKFVTTERARDSGLLYSDGSHVITVSAVTDADVTLAGGGTWSPAVGDIMSVGGEFYLVLDVTDTTHITVHTTGAATGAGTAQVGIECTMTPTVNMLKQAQAMKVWGEGSLWWESTQGVSRYTLGFQSPKAVYAGSTRILDATPAFTTSTPLSTKFAVPRPYARGTHVTATVKIRQALAAWAIEAISIKARITGDRPPTRMA